MDHRSEVREFLSTRRDRITPDRAGLPAYGGNRRVPGLRPADPGLTLSTYTAEPATASADALAVLASWTAAETRESRLHSQEA